MLNVGVRNKYPCRMPRESLVLCLERNGGSPVASQSGFADHLPTYTGGPPRPPSCPWGDKRALFLAFNQFISKRDLTACANLVRWSSATTIWAILAIFTSDLLEGTQPHHWEPDVLHGVQSSLESRSNALTSDDERTCRCSRAANRLTLTRNPSSACLTLIGTMRH